MSIYLDHHAASPLLASVTDVMNEARSVAWANPSSTHTAGRACRRVLEEAREVLARAIGARGIELVFTTGGTEACNLGVLGLAGMGLAGQRLLCTRLEHPAVAEAALSLGLELVWLETHGGVPPEHLPLEGVGLACVQWVNHETGTVLPVERYAAQCRAAGVPLFVDACQALGKLPVDLDRLGASAVAIAGSKIGGPPGAGALWIARDTEIASRTIGGGQERGRRAGTLDASTMAGFAHAASLVGERLEQMPAIASRRDRLESVLARHGVVNGLAAPRVDTVTNVSVRGWRGPRLVAALDVEGVMASHVAACSSGLEEPSKVIMAITDGELWRAEASLRLSLGPSTSDVEIDLAIEMIERVLSRKTPSSKF